MEGQMDMDRRTDVQTNRQMGRWTDWQPYNHRYAIDNIERTYQKLIRMPVPKLFDCFLVSKL